MKLPNILIKHIELSGDHETEVGIRVTTVIKDNAPGSSGITWSNTSVSDKIQTMVVISADKSLNDKITNGNIDFDIHTIMKNHPSSDKVKIFTNSAIAGKKIKGDVDTAVGQEEEIFFVDSHSAKFDAIEKNIDVFCCVYYERDQILRDLNIDSSNIKPEYGAISSEKIISFGRINNLTTVFILPGSRKQYTGPVHLHEEGGYMVGAKHTSAPHSSLNTLDVQNFKIKDYRKHSFVKQQTNDIPKVASISELYCSVNTKGQIAGLFSINFKNLLLNESLYGKYLKSLSTSALDEIIKNIAISNITIIRNRVDAKGITLLGRSRSMNGAMLDIFDDDKFSLSEVAINDAGSSRAFSFVDKQINKTNAGLFQYQVKVSFVDPTASFIKTMMRQLKNSIKTVDTYYMQLEKSKNYNFDLDETRESFWEPKTSRDRSSYSTYVQATEVYVRAMMYLYNINPIERADIIFSTTSKIDPRNATISSVMDFRDKLNHLSREYETTFSSLIVNDASNSSAVYVKSPRFKNKIFVDNLFKQKIRPKNFVTSYGYLNVSDETPLPKINKKDFISRFNREKRKFFTKEQPQQYMNSIPSSYKQLTDMDRNLYSYLSPNVLRSKNDTIILNDIPSINIKQINNIFNTSSPKSMNNNIYVNYLGFDDDSTNAEMSAPSTDDMPNKDSVIIHSDDGSDVLATTETKIDSFLESSIYLGDDSLFVTYDEKTAIIGDTLKESVKSPTKETSPGIKEDFNIKRNINEANSDEYNILSQNNLIFRASKSLGDNFKQFFLSLPNQIRALFMYRLKFVKKLQTNVSGDLLKAFSTQTAMNINYNKLVKIEIFDGYHKTGDLSNMREAKFRLITRKDVENLNFPVLCRLKTFLSNELKIKRDMLSFPIENQYFILQPDKVLLTQRNSLDIKEQNFRDIAVGHTTTKRYNLEGATTNIIIQTGTAEAIERPTDTPPEDQRTRSDNYTKPNDGSGGIIENSNAAGFNEAVGNINRLSTSGGGSSGGGY